MLHIQLYPWTEDIVCINLFGPHNKMLHPGEANMAEIHFRIVLEPGSLRATVVGV